MIAFIASMQRSGSTFVFNIVRELLSGSGKAYAEPSRSIQEVLGRSAGADHVILKSHVPDDLLIGLARHGAIKVFSTYRRVEDAVASLMEVFGFNVENSIARIRAWFKMYRRIRVCSLNIPYEVLRYRPEWIANKIRTHLGIATAADVAAITRKYSRERVFAACHLMRESDPGVINMGTSLYHRDTFLHRRHVPSLRDRVAKRELPVDHLCRVRSELADEIAYVQRCRLEDFRGIALANGSSGDASPGGSIAR
jgi:hypothetical protein